MRFAAAAGLSLVLAGAAVAADSPDWIVCQGKSQGAVDLDQLIQTCTSSAPCQDKTAPPDLKGVIDACSAVIQSPTEPPLRRALAAYQRGMARAIRHDPSDAVTDFNLALSLRPDFAAALERRGEARAVQGDDVRAIDDYTAAIKIDLNLAQAYSARALAYYRARDFDLAIADLTRAIALRPGDPGDLNNRCWMRAASGRDLAAGLADCNAAVRLRPGDPEALDSRGFVDLKLGNDGGAVADYDAALGANPRPNQLRASSLYGRGLAHSGLGDRAAGQADIAAALAIAPLIAQTYARYGLQP